MITLCNDITMSCYVISVRLLLRPAFTMITVVIIHSTGIALLTLSRVVLFRLMITTLIIVINRRVPVAVVCFVVLFILL